MKQWLWGTVALMTVAVVSVGCSNDSDDETLSNADNTFTPIQLTRAEGELVTGSNEFAFNLFRQVTQQEGEDKSLLLSPVSITYALGMLNNGAAGETRQQINNVLGFGEQGAGGINDFCRKMLSSAPKLDKLTKVAIANTIFTNKDYTLKPAFVKTAADYYDATPQSRDFSDGKTMDVINQWASDHTEKMIQEVLNEDTFDPRAVSYLLNAIYFKGAWSHKFSKGDTRDEPFEGVEQKVPMMWQKQDLTYAEDDLCQMVSLPYGNHAYSMTVLLPREGHTVGEVLATLDAESWRRYHYGMQTAEVDLKLPRFETKTYVGLNEVMSALGMPRAFIDGEAEFPEFCNVPTFIGLMKQCARIKLNEEGTEAAAVTVIGGLNATAFEPSSPKPVQLHATRPFLYVISEQSTGTIFFIGIYTGRD